MNLTILLSAAIYLGSADIGKYNPDEIYDHFQTIVENTASDWTPTKKYTTMEINNGQMITTVLKFAKLKIDSSLPSEKQGSIRDRRKLFKFNDKILKALVSYVSNSDENIKLMNNLAILSIKHPVNNQTYYLIPIENYYLKIVNESNVENPSNIQVGTTDKIETIKKENKHEKKVKGFFDYIADYLNSIHKPNGPGSIKIIGGTSAMQFTPVSYKFRTPESGPANIFFG